VCSATKAADCSRDRLHAVRKAPKPRSPGGRGLLFAPGVAFCLSYHATLAWAYDGLGILKTVVCAPLAIAGVNNGDSQNPINVRLTAPQAYGVEPI